ncbi:uncharacterized protein RAG0_00815 [Rhynchosporium agropyri]|uniref:Uncharacterized protein n=1 Tax=Rhynchosporium agropyri TaxID=914238 RepID=A0A1E1JYQ1_9HELO|nr:uncharacterized protein RAG0_00815 [Rhynchosporium agropyri]
MNKRALLFGAPGDTITLIVGNEANRMYYDELGITAKQFDHHTVFDGSRDIMDTKWGLWAQLYVLGDKYDLPQLRNHVMDVIVDQYIESNCQSPLGIVPYVYENTNSPDDPLRMFLVDVTKVFATRATIMANKNMFHAEFLFELTMAFADARRHLHFDDDDAADVDFCNRFHVHNIGDPICGDLRQPFVVDEPER